MILLKFIEKVLSKPQNLAMFDHTTQIMGEEH